MAYTRGASRPIQQGGVTHLDDGELLDKEGKPIPTTGHVVQPAPPQLDTRQLHIEPTPEDAWTEPESPAESILAPGPPPEPPPAPTWICEPETLARDANAWEFVRLLEIFLDRKFHIEMSDEQARALPADVRRHMKRRT
jgi:hypothetical protein